MPMTDYDYGVYILQRYADVAQISSQALVQNFGSKYSRDDIASLGRLAALAKLDEIKRQFGILVAKTPTIALGFPTLAALRGAIATAGAKQPGNVELITSGVVDGVKDAAKVVAVGLGGYALIVGVLAALVIAQQTGALKYAFKK